MGCCDGAKWGEGGFVVTVLGRGKVVGIVTINRGLEYVAVGETPVKKGWEEWFVCCRAYIRTMAKEVRRGERDGDGFVRQRHGSRSRRLSGGGVCP